MPALREYSHLKNWKTANKALGDSDSKVIGNNTKLKRLGNDIVVTLHGHRVVRYKKNGAVKISSAGYKTSTTKDRLNRYTDNKTSVVQRDYKWYVKRGSNKVEFTDGMTVYKSR